MVRLLGGRRQQQRRRLGLRHGHERDGRRPGQSHPDGQRPGDGQRRHGHRRFDRLVDQVGSSGTNATAPITFTVFGPGAEPTSCTGGTTLGTAAPAGDGTYTSSGTFTPSVAGDYWWYASSAGDANNNAAASACATGMSETVVGPPISATVVTSTANPAAYQTAVTLTATVTGTSGLGAPTGTVAFTDSSSNPLTSASGSDSTLRGRAPTTSSATCIYTPPASGGVGGAFRVVGTYWATLKTPRRSGDSPRT